MVSLTALLASSADTASNAAKNLRDRLSGGTEDRLGKALGDLLESPLLTGAIGRAFDAREKASQAQEVAMGALVVDLVDPHRAAPGDVGSAVEQPVRRAAEAGRLCEAHFDPFLFIRAERERRVIRRVEQPAQ